ncbi:MAG TPA: Flp family type IVb pilin [Ramlibacter sp.]|nr:Flp family type IVb pilin [Ramlibacter sp.]
MPQTHTQGIVARLLRDEDGAEPIEYALVIAVISIALVLALQPVFLGGQFGSFITRLSNCLSAAACN